MSIKNTSFSSKYLTDKIVFYKKGSVSISSLPNEYDDGYWVVKKLSMAHTFNRPLFIHFRFNFDGSSNWRTGGSSEVCIGYSNSSSLNILINNITTGTLYYEAFGSWIDDYDTTNPLISTITPINNIVFDSRLNSRKIIKQSYFTMNNLTNTTITHNLTYSPSYEVYFDGRPNEVWQTHSGGAQDPWSIANIGGLPQNDCDCWAISKINTLLISGHSRNFGSDTIKVWYRIFGDD